jgi:hypothetical protein
MIGAQFRNILEKELMASGEFDRKNPGLSTGDGFREMVEEAVKSTRVNAILMRNIVMFELEWPNIRSWVKANPCSGENYNAKSILANFDAFEGQMQFLYWGIQIGRKLERQEAASNLQQPADS